MTSYPQLPANVRQCIEHKLHLTWVDDNGVCNYCGSDEKPDQDDVDEYDPTVFPGDITPPHGWFFYTG